MPTFKTTDLGERLMIRVKGNEILKLHPLLKIQFYSYLVEHSQKATLNVLFKSRFSVEPAKFRIYFARDCSPSPHNSAKNEMEMLVTLTPPRALKKQSNVWFLMCSIVYEDVTALKLREFFEKFWTKASTIMFFIFEF